MDSKNPFAYRLDFLERLNKSRVNGQMLADIKIFEEYNVWHFFQTRLFYHDIVPPKNRSAHTEHSITFFKSIKTSALGCILILFSVGAVISSRVRKVKIFVYSIDKASSPLHNNDTRLNVVYRFLFDAKIPFTEVFHTLWDKSSILYAWHRKRLGLYLEAIDFCFPVCLALGIICQTFRADSNIDVSLFPKDEQEFARQLIKNYLIAIDRSVFRVKMFKRILSFVRPRAVFGIDDARDSFELMLACRMKKIPYYAFQHGHFTKYNVAWFPSKDFTGTLIGPDVLFLWSEFWKKEMLRFGTYMPESAIKIGGWSVLPKNIFQTRDRKNKPICVLVPYETYAIVEDVRKYIDAMLRCPDVEIVFKLRTDRTKEEQLSYYGLSDKYHSRFIIVYGDYDETKVDVVAGIYSTFLYDVVARGKSVLILETSIDFGEGLVKNGLANPLKLSDSICSVVADAASLPVETLQARQKILYGESPILLYDTLKQIAEELHMI